MVQTLFSFSFEYIFSFQKVQEATETLPNRQNFSQPAKHGVLAQGEDGGFSAEPDAGRTSQAEQGRGRGRPHLSYMWRPFWLPHGNTQTLFEPPLGFRSFMLACVIVRRLRIQTCGLAALK